MINWETVGELTKMLASIEELRNQAENTPDLPYLTNSLDNWLTQGEVIRQALVNKIIAQEEMAADLEGYKKGDRVC